MKKKKTTLSFATPLSSNRLHHHNESHRRRNHSCCSHHFDGNERRLSRWSLRVRRVTGYFVILSLISSVFKNGVALTPTPTTLPPSSHNGFLFPDDDNLSSLLTSSSAGLLQSDLSRLSSYQLVWEDDFDGDSLDTKKWYHLIDCSGRGNHELQCYTNRTVNVRVQDGLLLLTARPEKYSGKSYTSGRIHAAGKGWTYGFFEARVRLPKGKHLWPAVWMVPTHGTYGPWPMSGEIDIMEYRGQTPSSFQSTIHFGATRQDRGKMGTPMLDFGVDFSKEFHIFGFEWTNTTMSWFLDGVRYHHISTNRMFITDKGNRVYNKTGSPFDHNFKWILNVAVGGSYFPRSVFGDLKFKEALKWSKPVMEVDWVRVYRLPPTTAYSTDLADEKIESTTTTAITTTNISVTTANVTEFEITVTTTPLLEVYSATTTELPSSTTVETAVISTNVTSLTTESDKKKTDFDRPVATTTIPETPVTISDKKRNEIIPYDYESNVPDNSFLATTYYYFV